MMKRTFLAFFASLVFVTGGNAQGQSENPAPYKTIPRFGIPDGFYSDNELRSHMYLELYEVADTKKPLTHEEKLAAALLVIAAKHANYEKYHQSYGVSMGNPLLVLLKRNFPGLSEVKPSHDVNPGELPIADLGKFFRDWLNDALSEEIQERRVKRALGIEEEPAPKAEQRGVGLPAARSESK